MAELITRRLIDDIDGDKVEADAGTITFGVDNKVYEIDLCARNATRLRAWAGEFIPYAREVTTGGRLRIGPSGNHLERPKQKQPTRDREQSRAVREWARRNGMQTSDRGPIAGDILDAFYQAHREQAS